MIKKKGFTNVEFVISFVIFILFVFFLLIILNPFKQYQIDPVVINKIQRGLMGEVEVSVSKLGIKAKAQGQGGGVGATCFSVDYNDFESTNKIFVDKVGSGNVLAVFSGSQIFVDSGIGDYIVYSSDEFNPLNTPTPRQCAQNIEIVLGINEEYQYVSYRLLADLATEYESDYEGLKQRIGTDSEFSFELLDLDLTPGGITAIKGKPGKLDINARNIPIKVVWEDGRIEDMLLNLRVWG